MRREYLLPSHIPFARSSLVPPNPPHTSRYTAHPRAHRRTVMPLLPREGWHITACHHLGPSALALTAPLYFDRRASGNISLRAMTLILHPQPTLFPLLFAQSRGNIVSCVEVFGYRS